MNEPFPIPAGKVPLSAILHALARDESRDRVAASDLLLALGDRALAALLFFFSMPNVLPLPPGTSTILGVPLVFLAAQLAFGRRPWLPEAVASRSMARSDFAALVQRIEPWLARAERLLRPRAALLALPPMEYLVGFLCLLMAILLALPIPLGNMLPALTISLLALGVLERDGLWIVGGIVTAIISTALVSGVVFAMFKAAVFFFAEVL